MADKKLGGVEIVKLIYRLPVLYPSFSLDCAYFSEGMLWPRLLRCANITVEHWCSSESRLALFRFLKT